MTHSRSRGYVLLEAMVAAALTATALVVTLTLISDARTQTISAARMAAASSMVQGKLDEQRSLGFNGLTAGVTVENDVAGSSGVVRRTTTITGPTAEVVGAQTIDYMLVAVEVDVKALRTIKAEERIYR